MARLDSTGSVTVHPESIVPNCAQPGCELLVQVTPNFLPRIDGVGDYARLLGDNLRDCGITSRYVVGDPTWFNEGPPAGIPVDALSARSSSELTRSLETADAVLVHYVGYGYDVSGMPGWLLHGLERWKRAGLHRRLVVVFHELWASGPFWKREFYTSYFQKRIVVRLQRLCDGAVTSVAVMQRALERIHAGKTMQLPIPSAFPALDPGEQLRSGGGKFSVALFGQEASRLLGAQKHELLVRSLHQRGLLSKVRVFGRGAIGGADPSSDVAFLRTILPEECVEVLGDVTPEQGGNLLGSCDLFLSYYPSEYLCKSSALMAAMACGCVPVLPEAQRAVPLTDRVQILACGNKQPEVDELILWLNQGRLPGVARSGANWYRENVAWEIVAGRIAVMLRAKRH